MPAATIECKTQPGPAYPPATGLRLHPPYRFPQATPEPGGPCPSAHGNAPALPGRRTFLAQALATAGMLSLAPGRVFSAAALLVANVTGLYSIEVARIEAPVTTQDVSRLVRAWPGKVAVGGGRYSMGGQVALRGGLHLDMRSMNRLVSLQAIDKVVRVQAGMRWRDLQDVLDPLNLAVKTMQSYSNFTVGGSVSVNAHGRYVGHGPVGNTVRALQLVLADGSVLEASRAVHAELFSAAIGGYGAVGVITEVELDLADNVRIERALTRVPLHDYVRHFEQQVLADPACVLHNADLVPPRFDSPTATTWRKSDKPLTEPQRLIPRGQRYRIEKTAIWAATELTSLRRKVIQPLQAGSHPVLWLNHEASLDVTEIEPLDREHYTYVLQEYFIPKRNFVVFAQGMASILLRNAVQAINISIRHSPPDGVSLLPWAKEEVFAFVLYYKQETHAAAQDVVARWTRELVGLALQHQGRHYLPYQRHATTEQFNQAYPEAAALRELKRSVDPLGKLSNELWAKYL